MKKSFTMLELIFVIVILGILAVVAIPKLIATRDDAQTARLTSQAQSAMKEIISYYTAKGGEINFSKIANDKSSQIVLNELINHGWVEVKDDNTSYFYSNKAERIACIIYKTNGLKIKVEMNSSDNDTLCSSMKKIITDRNYSILNQSINF
jgi:type II secretory pathway pseudopilin PulG